ncbi:dTDP-glucose 4,6-dehydratase [Thermocrinis minervae]|uniref:dTDP-glucose 4,6-dehydratase n=1 Tax=Thermocrinis minervae TaxID=381751 RepID=A0A1M6SA26_9AQUI|nr:dTDP-glucose 4,6-dehydratase [Thermocrinis minervae]SHK41551.1 dTDP-glucose 4,6-dehydratase [Thermocrinis minervae]
MKLLVTGGAGFIGSEFVRQAVKRGYSVVVVDKLTYAGDLERLKEVSQNIIFYKIDIADFKSLKEVFENHRPEAVIHFAAETHVDRSILNPYDFLHSNIIGTYNLCELSRRYEVEKFINISTDEVYGELGNEGKFTEQTPLNPNSPYSVSKASADMLGRAYYRTYGLPVITVRPSNNYGPWQYPEKLIPVVIAKALLNEPVPVYGDGSNIREWLYVEDCAEAIFDILEKGKIGEVYNVSSGEERRNIEVVSMILKLLDKPLELISFVKDRPGHDFRYSSSFEKLKNELGWQPKTTFEEGLEKTVRWYIDHQDWLFKKVKEVRDYWEKVYR